MDGYRVDLHMHSGFSDDADIPPATLAAMAARNGLSCVALCDHNAADGNGPFLEAARKAGLTAIPGIEIDCDFEGNDLHLLGYFIEYADARFAALRDAVRERKRAVRGRCLAAIRGLGIVLDDARLDALSRDGGVTGEAIAKVALGDPANDGHPLLEPFRPGGARADNPLVNFYWDICAKGKAAHVHIDHMPLGEAARLIAETGGTAVLAHPGQSLPGREGLIDAIVRQGVRGVEAYSSYHSPAQRAFWLREAERLQLLVACGSDFHGETKPAINMGDHGAEGREREIAEALFAAAGKTLP